MTDNNNTRLFENDSVRTVWDEEKQEWYFSIIDVISVLTDDGSVPDNYWRVLKKRLKREGSQLATNCNQLKMKATNGKYYTTDFTDTEGILRLIQSIRTPKAEPFKMWLASVGKERLDELIDPELAIDRAFATYARKGYSKAWINQRALTLQVRNELASLWHERGVKESKECEILIDEILRACSGMTMQQYKHFKDLKKADLTGNVSLLELTLNQLAKISTTEILRKEKLQTFEANKAATKCGDNVAGVARQAIEAQIGNLL